MVWLCKTKIWWKRKIVYIKTSYIWKDIGEGVETIFDTSNYELDWLLPKGKNKKVWINERWILLALEQTIMVT